MAKAKQETNYWLCIDAATQFYTKGRIYKIALNEEGHRGFIGNDGRFDLKSMVVSKFIGSSQEAYDKQLQSVT